MTVEAPVLPAAINIDACEECCPLFDYVKNSLSNDGVIVSKSSVSKLDAYYACSRTLPGDKDAVVRFLDFKVIDDPELTPESMLIVFNQIQSHADGWLTLRVDSERLSDGLIVHAQRIQVQGAEVEELARKTHALGLDPAEWNNISHSPDQTLDMHDRAILESMVSVLESLRSQVNAFDHAVTELDTRLQVFRDKARFEHIPAVLRKGKALSRWPARRQAIDNSLWLMILAFTEKLNLSASNEDVDKMTKLAHQLERELSEVVVESGKLHSVWQAIDTYLENAALRLKRMEGRQSLAKSMLYYRLFLAQWEGIERHAREASAMFE